jgi:hypothetical protein
MATRKAFEIWLDSKLPDKYRGKLTAYDNKSIQRFLAGVAQDDPESFATITKAVGDVGRLTGYRQGNTLGVQSMSVPFDKPKLLGEMRAEIVAATKGLTDPKKKADARMGVWRKYNDLFQKLTTEKDAERDGEMSRYVGSGARGKPQQHKLMIGASGLFADPLGNTIDFFEENSYAEGVRPAGLLAATYGARTSVLDTKRSTAKGGYVEKLLVRGGAFVPITERKCDSGAFLVRKADSPDLRGRVLAEEVDGIPAGTIVSTGVLEKLRRFKGRIPVRSPLTCTAETGVCAYCAGANAKGKLPNIGDQAGIQAGTALGEPLAQCLAEGTLVRMADGSEKAIESIQVGEQVLGFDSLTKTSPTEVLTLFDQGQQTTWKWVVSAPRLPIFPRATEDHKVLRLSDLKPITLAQAEHDKCEITFHTGAPCKVLYRTEERVEHCYDIEVANKLHMFVLENGLVVSNSALSSKHTGGAVGSAKSYGGLDNVVNSIMLPGEFEGKATVAEEDGKITEIRPAPQGGNFITIGDKDIFVPQGTEIQVKTGDVVEAGQPLTEGLVSAVDIANTRGVGDARMAWMKTFERVARDNGQPPHWRNMELMARGMVNHVEMGDEPMSDYLPGDTAFYSTAAKSFQAPEDANYSPLSGAAGKVLVAPALHYTIGTKLRPSVIKDLEEAGISAVKVSDKEVQWKPVVVSGPRVGSGSQDWSVHQHSSWLKNNLVDDAVNGLDTNTKENYHFVPRLAVGTDFGKDIATTGKF